ncbi:ferrous iron transport protein B [Enterococcus hirae]|jgi:ferrous iron transport protein B|nr:ferrous iron transport protein B [Enterococcaceae bacterium]MCI1919833.1 ferrous iron transport protein B [Enterococcaceae bacterium]MDM8212639.1 ferrous iron transport protein B [Enterococcus hirae]
MKNEKKINVALAGNPNSGKTSLFNGLTGAAQYVGNWPGVTVEKKSGVYRNDSRIVIQDLPGCYSLSPYTSEEIVSRDYLIQGNPDAVVDVVDVTNLERHLYLTTQLIETGHPVVMALNMIDLLEKDKKAGINVEKLSYALGIPVIETSAVKNKGLVQLMEAVAKRVEDSSAKIQYPDYSSQVESALSEIGKVIKDNVAPDKLRWYSIKLFERDDKAKKEVELNGKQLQDIEDIIGIVEKLKMDDSESVIVNERYDYIHRVVELCMVDRSVAAANLTDKIDRIITNKWLSVPIFALIMWAVYYLSIQTVGTWGTDWINDQLFGKWVPDFLNTWMQNMNVAAWLQDLVLNGVIAGVGAVLGFLPQIVVLFLCLSFLEDCGYMARIAFVMDRIFRKVGLSGKQFIPMLIATGCGVPAVTATRTIENEQDRRISIMVTTFIPCSAKLPIIGLIAGAFFPHSSWVAPSAYFVGIAAIILSGIGLKKTRFFSADAAPFIMELPNYHLPNLRNALLQTWDKAKGFIHKAGTIIFVSSIGIWFLSTYNFRLQNAGESNSILANIGHVVAPIFKPLGWGTWQNTVAVFTGLVAKENLLGTLGILFGSQVASENGTEIWTQLRAAISPVAGYSFLIFNLLCAPCFAAIGSMYREMGSAKWTWGAIAYQCGLAYAVSFVIYQIGSVLFEGAAFNIATILALLVIALGIYFIVRKPKARQHSLGKLANDAL